jgi:hypothetical protein
VIAQIWVIADSVLVLARIDLIFRCRYVWPGDHQARAQR